LDSSLVQVILEQQGGHKRVVIVRKGSNKRHGSEFIIQLVQSEPYGSQIANAVYCVVHTVNKRLEVLLIAFSDREQVIIGIEASTRLFLHVNPFQNPPHLHSIVLNPPEMHPLSGLNHQPHNTSSLVCLDLICFEFLLLSIPGRYAECRDLGSARNDPPECLSTIPSLHVTTPSAVVVGVEFVKGRH
jgi:hypothetical protein